MPLRRHPLSGALYDVLGDGLVEVTHKGLSGVFDSQGRWVRGELRQCDPMLALWLAGPQLPAGFPGNPKDFPGPAPASAPAPAPAPGEGDAR